MQGKSLTPAGHPADHVCHLGYGQATLVLKMQHTHFSPATKSMHVCAGPFLRGGDFCLVCFVTFWGQWRCLITACAVCMQVLGVSWPRSSVSAFEYSLLVLKG